MGPGCLIRKASSMKGPLGPAPFPSCLSPACSELHVGCGPRRGTPDSGIVSSLCVCLETEVRPCGLLSAGGKKVTTSQASQTLGKWASNALVTVSTSPSGQ